MEEEKIKFIRQMARYSLEEFEGDFYEQIKEFEANTTGIFNLYSQCQLYYDNKNNLLNMNGIMAFAKLLVRYLNDKDFKETPCSFCGLVDCRNMP